MTHLVQLLSLVSASQVAVVILTRSTYNIAFSDLDVCQRKMYVFTTPYVKLGLLKKHSANYN